MNTHQQMINNDIITRKYKSKIVLEICTGFLEILKDGKFELLPVFDYNHKEGWGTVEEFDTPEAAIWHHRNHLLSIDAPYIVERWPPQLRNYEKGRFAVYHRYIPMWENEFKYCDQNHELRCTYE
jgi:hypothetical protein